jgi:(E)-4-hydroxy-3-methylbut-2-enyl-diphosphate synthase
MCGSVPIGGGALVSIQSMTNTDTRDALATAGQIEVLAAAGCDIVRCAVPDGVAATALTDIRAELAARGVRIPIVADIHFDYRLAIAAIENGADKIRINPGNIGDDGKVRAVAERAKAAGIPIRVGVNGGSLEGDAAAGYGGEATAEALAESALRNIDKLSSMGFDDVVVSVKSSDVRLCGDALRILSSGTDAPVHLGVTEAGAGDRALIKSAIGIGSLLTEGIGDTIRVSLTCDPVREISAARDILASIGMLPGAIDVISCPTCGRCNVDLARIADEVREAVALVETERVNFARRERFAACVGAPGIAGSRHGNGYVSSGMESGFSAFASGSRDSLSDAGDVLTVAVMGCAVNGPGEAAHADIGVACGKGNAVLFEGGVKTDTLAEADIIPVLLAKIRLAISQDKERATRLNT